MSAVDRDRRMARLLALGEQSARASEARFAHSISCAADAAATLSHIEGLILTAAPMADARNVAALMSAAHLRGLLVPAAAAAASRLSIALRARCEAEARLVVDRSRASRFADQARTARHALIAEATAREANDRPQRSRKTGS